MCIRDRPYVDAARLMTTSPLWIIVRHVVPAVTPVIVVSVVVTASRAVLSAAGLAFLGLLSLIHISEPTRLNGESRMPS